MDRIQQAIEEIGNCGHYEDCLHCKQSREIITHEFDRLIEDCKYSKDLVHDLAQELNRTQSWLDRICEPWIDKHRKFSKYTSTQDLIRWWYRQAATSSTEGQVMRVIADYLEQKEKPQLKVKE